MPYIRHARFFVYEWRDLYIVMLGGWQNGYTNETISSDPSPIEEIGVYAKFSAAQATAHDIGCAVKGSLAAFGTVASKYMAWEMQERGRELAKAIGARGMPSFIRDSRRISVDFDNEKEPHRLIVCPWDACHREPWITPLESLKKVFPPDVSEETLGEAVLQALKQATWDAKKKAG